MPARNLSKAAAKLSGKNYYESIACTTCGDTLRRMSGQCRTCQNRSARDHLKRKYLAGKHPFVCYIADDGRDYIKIGYTDNLLARFSDYSRYPGIRVIALLSAGFDRWHAKKVERFVRSLFKESLVRSDLEWHHRHTELLDFAAAVASQHRDWQVLLLQRFEQRMCAPPSTGKKKTWQLWKT